MGIVPRRILLSACLAIVACSSDSGPEPVPRSARARIGPEGGLLAIEGAALRVPAGALASETEVGISRSETAPVGLDARSAVVQLEPDGLVFRRPVSVSIAVEAPGEPLALYWTDRAGVFRARPSVRGPDVVAAQGDHFSAIVVARPTKCTTVYTQSQVELLPEDFTPRALAFSDVEGDAEPELVIAGAAATGNAVVLVLHGTSLDLRQRIDIPLRLEPGRPDIGARGTIHLGAGGRLLLVKLDLSIGAPPEIQDCGDYEPADVRFVGDRDGDGVEDVVVFRRRRAGERDYSTSLEYCASGTSVIEPLVTTSELRSRMSAKSATASGALRTIAAAQTDYDMGDHSSFLSDEEPDLVALVSSELGLELFVAAGELGGGFGAGLSALIDATAPPTHPPLSLVEVPRETTLRFAELSASPFAGLPGLEVLIGGARPMTVSPGGSPRPAALPGSSVPAGLDLDGDGAPETLGITSSGVEAGGRTIAIPSFTPDPNLGVTVYERTLALLGTVSGAAAVALLRAECGELPPLDAGVSIDGGPVSLDAEVAPDGGSSDAGSSDAGPSDVGSGADARADAGTGGPSFDLQSSGTTETLNTIAWGGGRYLAGGPARTLIESPDGLNWIPADATGLAASDIIVSVAYASTLDVWLVAVQPGAYETNLYRRATGDPQWNLVGSALPFHSRLFWAGAPVERFLALADDGLHVSADGVGWSTPTTAPSGPLYAAAWNGSTLAIAGVLGQVATSIDGETWTPRSTTAQGSIFDLAASGSNFVGVSLATVPEVLRSDDEGASWTVTPMAITPASVGHTRSEFVLFESQAASYSIDGAAWTPILPWPYSFIAAMTSAGPRVVAVGEAGRVLTLR